MRLARVGRMTPVDDLASLTLARIVVGWPDHSATEIFNVAEQELDGLATMIALPLTPCASRSEALIDAALADLVRVVLALYPAWLPGAEGINSPVGAGAAAVEDIARAVAGNSTLFGPLLVRLARGPQEGGG